MNSSGETAAVVEQAFEALAGLVQNRSGQGWGVSGRAALIRAAESRIKALSLSGPAGYLSVLEKNEWELSSLIAGLTDKGTAWFRNPAQFEALAQGLLPDLTRRREERVLNLVSLGCSTGQEAYSLAILVKESGLLNKGWEIKVYGADLDPKSVAAARAGLYMDTDLGGLSPDAVRRWFRPMGPGRQVRGELRDLVSWAEFNLIGGPGPPWPELRGRADVILLKNVLISLTPLAGQKAADTLAELAAPEGVLLMGPTEGLPFGEKHFAPERWGGVLFRRRISGKKKVNPPYVTRKARRASAAGPQQEAEAPGVGRPGKKVRALLKEGAELLAGGRPDEAWVPLEAAFDRTAERGELCAPALGLAARGHLALKRWAEARDIAGRAVLFLGDTPWAHMLLAEAAAGQGLLPLARHEWERAAKVLAGDPAWVDDPYFRLDPAWAGHGPAELIKERLSELKRVEAQHAGISRPTI